MQYDILVVGGGPAGYVAAIRASQLGFKVGLVEREAMGGICLNWGCIPTKALLKSAQVLQYARNASKYGISVGAVEANFTAVVQRSRAVADRMSKGVNFLMNKNKIDIVKGVGKLTTPSSLEVSGSDGSRKQLSARHIILATGARAKQLPNVPIDGKKVIGYREALALQHKPSSLIVMGSGAIGVEFAYFFHSMGTKVTIVEYQDRIVPNEDADISKELAKVYKNYGIEVLTSSSVEGVQHVAAGVTARVRTPQGQIDLSADLLLSACGVCANIEGIGLETVGVKTEKGHVVVSPYYQTNVKGVYAIGDIVPGQALAHVASKEALICVEKIAFEEKKLSHQPEVLDYNNVPGCTYCVPEIASVGYTEAQAKQLGYDVKVGIFPFSASGKASASGHNEGFVKVVFDAKYGGWLGAHLIGANVTEMITEATVARKLETTYHEVLNSVHPHPTMNEAIMEAVAAAYGEVIHL